ncbi:MAG TPA: hypothetical protein VGQ62_23055 [Chloroflexota bacterium]|jgi:heme A synthase|nr:hypothetical protein [Chloroflexota bacterium]
MKSESVVGRVLPFVITLLALADGVVHLSLDAILFRGNFIGRLGPPPGAPQGPPPGGFPPPPPVPLPLPLNQMFVLNFVGYVVLAVLFWLALRRFRAWQRWIDVAFIVYVVVALLAWVDLGMPNPMGLGYLSKAIEIPLVVALLVHLARNFQHDAVGLPATA